MCFSATADAVAGSVVAAAGAVALASVTRVRDVPMAALPLLLGLHQLAEAFVWHDLDHGGGGAGWARAVWAWIAFPLLPVLVPAAVLIACRACAGPVRRAVLGLCLAAGVVVGVVLAHAVVSGPITVADAGRTLRWGVGVPYPAWIGAGYLTATVGALVAAPDRWLRVLGLVCAAGAVVCGALWYSRFPSTWCAFAAVASLVVLAWVRTPEVRRPAGGAARRRTR